MLELLTDAEKEKMTAAGEEFYTEYFAEGENDGDFHAETESDEEDSDISDEDQSEESSSEDADEELRIEEKMEKKRGRPKKFTGKMTAPQPDSSDDERKESKKKLLHQKCKDEYGLTQEQMLEETKRTESENKESLAALLRIEEERKRIVIRKPPMTGSLTKLFSTSRKSSKVNCLLVTIFQDVPLPKAITMPKIAAPPKKAVCAVTGLPAKYFDPEKKKPYANIAAFKSLRKIAA